MNLFYFFVIGSQKRITVDFENHVTDDDSSLETREREESVPSWLEAVDGSSSSSYQISHAVGLNIRNENTTADFSVFTLDDHDTQTRRTLDWEWKTNESS